MKPGTQGRSIFDFPTESLKLWAASGGQPLSAQMLNAPIRVLRGLVHGCPLPRPIFEPVSAGQLGLCILRTYDAATKILTAQRIRYTAAVALQEGEEDFPAHVEAYGAEFEVWPACTWSFAQCLAEDNAWLTPAADTPPGSVENLSAATVFDLIPRAYPGAKPMVRPSYKPVPGQAMLELGASPLGSGGV